MVVPRYDPTVHESWGTQTRAQSPRYSHSAAGVRCWREGRSSEESLRKAEGGWTAHEKGSEDSSLKLMASVILSTVRRQRQRALEEGQAQAGDSGLRQCLCPPCSCSFQNLLWEMELFIYDSCFPQEARGVIGRELRLKGQLGHFRKEQSGCR